MKRKYVGIQYFSEIREMISTSAIIKKMYVDEGAEFLMLNTGETIRLDQLIRVDNQPSPGNDKVTFTCYC